MKRADINNEIAARIATGLLHRALKFTRPRLHACFCRVAAIFFPEVVQIITGFLGNADYKIKKRERFDIRLRFPASIAVNGGKPQIRRIVKNRNGPRLSLLEKMWQILEIPAEPLRVTGLRTGGSGIDILARLAPCKNCRPCSNKWDEREWIGSVPQKSSGSSAAFRCFARIGTSWLRR